MGLIGILGCFIKVSPLQKIDISGTGDADFTAFMSAS